MESKAQARLGTQVGVGILVWLAVVDLLAIWIAMQMPSSLAIVIFLIAIAVLATLPGMLLIGYWLYGLNHTEYALDRNMLTIRWGLVQQVIPMASIRRLLHGEEIIGHVSRFRGGRWPGLWVGQGKVNGVGPILFYAAGGLAQQLVIVTDGLAYAISPDDFAGFVEAFDQRQKMGPTQPVEQVSIRPDVFDWALWTDRVAISLVGAAGTACLLLFGYTCLRFPDLAPRVPLHFDAVGVPDRFGLRSQVFLLPFIGLLALGANGVIGLALYLRDRIGAYLLWGGAIVVQILAWVASIGILG
jgi:hypothetical protein